QRREQLQYPISASLPLSVARALDKLARMDLHDGKNADAFKAQMLAVARYEQARQLAEISAHDAQDQLDIPGELADAHALSGDLLGLHGYLDQASQEYDVAERYNVLYLQQLQNQ